MITQHRVYNGPAHPRIIPSKCPGIVRTQYRCEGCCCNVSPANHVPGSQDCEDAYWERIEGYKS